MVSLSLKITAQVRKLKMKNITKHYTCHLTLTSRRCRFGQSMSIAGECSCSVSLGSFFGSLAARKDDRYIGPYWTLEINYYVRKLVHDLLVKIWS